MLTSLAVRCARRRNQLSHSIPSNIFPLCRCLRRWVKKSEALRSGVLRTFRMKDSKRVHLLTYVTAFVYQELLLQNEYLAAENRILRAHLPARLRLADPERSTFAEIGKRLGRKA